MAPLSLCRDVDLSVAEALDQILGRQIDELDVVGALEDHVRHGLPHPHPGDPCNDVVQALEVLDVDGGVDLDAGVEELLDVRVALLG